MKIFNNISKEKAQRILFITVLILVFGVFFISLSLLGPGEDKDPNDNNPPIQDDDDDDDDNVVTYEVVKTPYSSNIGIKVVRKYWSKDQSLQDQEMSLIVFGSRYETSKGVSYATENKEAFDVRASLSGKVVDVQESPIYGNTVTIEHTNGIKTEYLSLGSVEVEVDDVVAQGDVIGKSGENEYDATVGNHVHFKFFVNNKYVDPNTVYQKATNTITN